MTGRCISVRLSQSLWCYPVKNSLFAIISSNLWTQALAWTQAQRQSMKTLILWALATDVSAPDRCRSPFLRDPGSLGGAGEDGSHWLSQALPSAAAAEGRRWLPSGRTQECSSCWPQEPSFQGMDPGWQPENWATKHVLLSRRRQKPRVSRTEWRQCHRPPGLWSC